MKRATDKMIRWCRAYLWGDIGIVGGQEDVKAEEAICIGCVRGWKDQGSA